MTLLLAFVKVLVFTGNSTPTRSLLPYSPCQIQIGPIKLGFERAWRPKRSLMTIGAQVLDCQGTGSFMHYSIGRAGL